LGKICGLIKGVRGLQGVTPWYLEPISLQAMVVYERRRSPWALVTHCDLVEPFDGIRRDWVLSAYAAYFVDLTDALTGLGDPQPEIFDLLVKGLQAMERVRSVRWLSVALAAHLLQLNGLLPPCDTMPLSPSTKALRQILSTPIDESDSLHFSQQEEVGLQRFLMGLVRKAIERPLPSYRYLLALGLEEPLTGFGVNHEGH